MRYLKVLILVCLFFFVMLFFVQNQAVFSQSIPLKLDLMFIPVKESMPLPIYTLFLVCFLLGGLITLLMLIWDRLAFSTKLTFANMKSRSLEKEVQKTNTQVTDLKTKLTATETKLSSAETKTKEVEQSLKETQDKLNDALDKIASMPVPAPVEE